MTASSLFAASLVLAIMPIAPVVAAQSQCRGHKFPELHLRLGRMLRFRVDGILADLPKRGQLQKI
jgi:hypothetical protein